MRFLMRARPVQTAVLHSRRKGIILARFAPCLVPSNCQVRVSISQGERIWHNTIFPRHFNGLASKKPGKQRGAPAIRAELCQLFWQPYNVQFRVQATDSKRLFSNALTLNSVVPAAQIMFIGGRVQIARRVGEHPR
jgi:hypothetical protein